jgi:endonuclease YncB( thermonuclease family)
MLNLTFFEQNTLFGVPFLNYAVGAVLFFCIVFFVYWLFKMIFLSFRAFIYGHFVLVTQVIDGDTFKCKPIITNRRKKKILTVRLIGIDTPESVKSQKKDIAPHGIESSNYSKNRLSKGKFLILLQDTDTIDHYGRELCYAYTFWGEFFNATLVRKGMAWAYRYAPNLRHADYLERLNNKARQKGIGLWKMYAAPNELSQKYQKSAEYKKFVAKYGKPTQLG